MMYFCFAVVVLGVIGTALGLASSRWLLTLSGLLIWWFGTFMMIVTLDLIAIGVTVQILSEPSFCPMPFDFEIEPRIEFPPPKVDKET